MSLGVGGIATEPDLDCFSNQITPEMDESQCLKTAFQGENQFCTPFDACVSVPGLSSTNSAHSPTLLPACTYSRSPIDANPCPLLADGGVPWTAPVSSVQVRVDGLKANRSADQSVGSNEHVDQGGGQGQDNAPSCLYRNEPHTPR